MRELDRKKALDAATLEKIREFATDPQRVDITRTAERDCALLDITKIGVAEAALCHVISKKAVFCDFLDSGEAAYVMVNCAVGPALLYLKVKFYVSGSGERMLIISAHPDRRW